MSFEGKVKVLSVISFRLSHYTYGIITTLYYQSRLYNSLHNQNCSRAWIGIMTKLSLGQSQADCVSFRIIMAEIREFRHT